MNPQIRWIEGGDLERVVAALPSSSPKRHWQRFEAQQRGGFAYLIAWIDGDPVGFVGVGLREENAPDVLAESRGFAMVDDLFVAEGFRRRGVGRALMVALEDEARAASMPGVILDTGTDAYYEPARGLYRSLGYVDLGGVYLGGWSNPDRPGVHFVDPLTIWFKPFDP